jgi:subtilase family serine protease
MSRRLTPWLAFAGLTAGYVLSLPSTATELQQAARALQHTSAARVTTQVESTSTFALPGTAPRKAMAQFDAGAMSASDTVSDITLVLKRDDDHDNAFRSYLSRLNNPASPDFHHWLTAAQIGERFGPSLQDVKTVQQWLRSQRMTVSSVSGDRMRITFSGPASAVSKAFGTQLHRYTSSRNRNTPR